jgi:hypothetical protein
MRARRSGGLLAAVGVEMVAVQVGDAERQVQGLAAVEAGIAGRLVTVAQVTSSPVNSMWMPPG